MLRRRPTYVNECVHLKQKLRLTFDANKHREHHGGDGQLLSIPVVARTTSQGKRELRHPVDTANPRIKLQSADVLAVWEP